MQRPDPSEYHEYYRGYVENVPEGDILSLLQTEVVRTRSLLERVRPSEKTTHTRRASGASKTSSAIWSTVKGCSDIARFVSPGTTPRDSLRSNRITTLCTPMPRGDR